MASVYPNDLLCPITLSLMRDPVVGTDGHTYERSAITEWLRTHVTSPVTREPMSATRLITNIALRNTIDAFLSGGGANSAAGTNSAGSDVTEFIPAPIIQSTTEYTIGGDRYTHTSVVPPAVGARQPITFIAILDNSGSMGEVADNSGIDRESHGFTRMDLVKHAMRTIIEVLEAKDTLAIVSFSTDAKIVMRPLQMSSANKARANTALNTVVPDSSTNIWEGIKTAASLADDPALSTQHIVAMLLTDGHPTINPPRGILDSLRTIIKLRNTWSLHTFGFGYNLDSSLLADIAVWGNGMYGFIPDCSMVGTVFINFMATMLSTAERDIVLSDGSHTGPIQYGQQRDFITLSGRGEEDSSNTAMTVHHARYMFMKAIAEAISKCKSGTLLEAQRILANFEAIYARHADPVIKAYIRDIKSDLENEGQIGMSPAYFGRWGEHHMRAYLRAQQLQLCMNFKDPGLQVYGGEGFHAIQIQTEAIFCSLPPPRPSITVSTAPVTSMGVFHNASGGCFHGDSKIRMADGGHYPINQMVSGMQVATPYGGATIVALVVCNTYANSQPMCNVGNLWITPWHPVRIDNKWQFPANIVGYTDRVVSTVYNLVLDCNHIVYAEDIECVTLGHGIGEDVVSHNFFGTNSVIEDLKKCNGWDVGRPTFVNLVSERDPISGDIVGWTDKP